MKSFFFVPVLLLLAACQSNSTTSTTEVATPEVPATEATEPAQAAAAPATPEHIEWNMLTVNGQLHEQISTKLLETQLGRPDSIAREVVECGGELDPVNDKNGDLWYYGRTRYEVAGPQAVLASFDVTTGKYQGKLGKLVLDKNTTLEDVRRFYPVSAKDADVPTTDQSGEMMYLPFYEKGEPMDAGLHLLFKKGKLQEVEFFYPC